MSPGALQYQPHRPILVGDGHGDAHHPLQVLHPTHRIATPPRLLNLGPDGLLVRPRRRGEGANRHGVQNGPGPRLRQRRSRARIWDGASGG